MRNPTLLVLCATLLVSLATAPAEAGEGNFEISAGAYVSGLNAFINEDTALGVRGGYRFNDRWGLQGSISRVDLFDSPAPIVDVDGDATFFDVSGMLFLNPRRKAEVFLYGGVGLAKFDVDVGRIRFGTNGSNVDIPGFHLSVDDDFTGHFGAGVNIRLSEKMYLRPDIRTRWLGNFDGGTVDVETSIGLGWRF